MIDFSNITAVALGVEEVIQIEDSLGTVLWQKAQPVTTYNVSISAGSNGTVSVNGVSGDYSQSVPAGTVLTIEGTGTTGYDFDEWSDGNTDNPRTITVNSDLTLTASFIVQQQLNNEIWYETNNNQTANFSNAGFNGTQTSNTYSNNKGVATYSANITSASGNSGTSTATNLTKISFPDTLTSIGQHTFDGCPLTELDLNNVTSVGYEAFDGNHIQHLHIPATLTTITNNPFRSSTITQITVDSNNPNYNDGSAHNGSNCIYQSTTLISGCVNTVIPDNCTIIGDWAMSNNYSLTTVSLPSTVTQIKQYAFAGDTTVPVTTLYARSNPSFGQQPFMGWQTNGTLYYTSGVNYQNWLNRLPSGWTAVLLCDVSVSAGNNGTVSVDGVSGNYHQSEVPSGTQLTLVATPAAGYQFDSWSDGDTNASRTVTITADTTLTASFVQQIPTYNVTITAGNNGTVSVNGVSGNYSQSVQSGTQLTIAATANNGYEFDEWSDNVSTNPRTITITGNTTLTASFVQQIPSYSVSISAGNNGSVSVNGVSGNYSATVQSGTQLTLAATPNTGYQFDSWSDGDTNATRTVTITGNTTLTASFVQAQPVGEPFYVEDASGNGLELKIRKNYSDAPTVEVFSSTDQQNWTSMGNTSTTDITTTVPANGKVYLKATANQWGTVINDRYNYIYTTQGNFKVGGHLSSLLLGDNYTTNTLDTSYTNQFFNLFIMGNNRLIDASDLVMPDNTAERCYMGMFNGCTALTAAPTLPATTLGEFCYYNMFKGCTSLTTAPALPATATNSYCYTGMFNGCTSLATAPALPATTITDGCYAEMFKGCTSLTTAPALPATTIRANYCYQSMFQGCTSLVQAPTLPATTLGYTNSYAEMFSGCTSLNSIVVYLDSVTGLNCITNWLQNVASTGDFFNLGTYTFPSGASGIPSGWTEHTSL